MRTGVFALTPIIFTPIISIISISQVLISQQPINECHRLSCLKCLFLIN